MDSHVVAVALAEMLGKPNFTSLDGVSVKVYSGRLGYATWHTSRRPFIPVAKPSYDLLPYGVLLVRCAPSWPRPLVLYARVDLSVARRLKPGITARLSSLILRNTWFDRRRRWLCNRYPSLCEALGQLRMNGIEYVADGERLDPSEIVSCPKVYGLVSLTRKNRWEAYFAGMVSRP